MGRAIFTRWLEQPRLMEAAKKRGVTMNGDFATWETLLRKAKDLAATLSAGHAYVADPTANLDGIIALCAIAMTPDTVLLWAKAQEVPFPLQPLAPGLFLCQSVPNVPLTRPLYATLTSGSSGIPKIPLAYGDLLELIALHYDAALYQPTFPGHPEVNVLATCLPLSYAAAFIMLIVPALFLAKDLLVFPPHKWGELHKVAAREHVVCLCVPSLMAAASVSTVEPIDMSKAALIMASGYLSRARVEMTRAKFRGVSLLNCYGASETGVVTLDRDPDGSFHVGQPIFGKPVWLEDVDEHGIGKVATSGLDCREFYWEQDRIIRRSDGVVALTDRGHFDERGNLYLDGRLDGGEKLHGVTIYPRQIERHLLNLDGVADVRIYITSVNGIDHLAARIVGSVTEAQVRAYCSTLPEISRPTLVECFTEEAAVYSAHGKL